MTEKLSRRNAIVLGLGAGTAPTWALPVGGEVDTTTQGVNIKLVWSGTDGWMVLIPNFEYMKTKYWVPGLLLPWKTVALAEYLSELEDYFELVPKV